MGCLKVMRSFHCTFGAAEFNIMHGGRCVCWCRMQLCPLCNTIRRTLYNNVRRTVWHMKSCPPGHCCIMQVCPPGHICICSCVHPVQNRPCSELIAIGRRNTFAPCFYKLSACHEWHGKMFDRWVFRCNHKIREWSCMLHIVRRFSACTLICTAMSCLPGGFCITPDTFAYAKVFGADSIAWRTLASDTGPWRFSPPLWRTVCTDYVWQLAPSFESSFSSPF